MSEAEWFKEFLTNPTKRLEYQHFELSIKNLQNQWKYVVIGFILGLITTISGVVIERILPKNQPPTNGAELSQAVHSQAETIRLLTTENTTLRQTVTALEDSLRLTSVSAGQ